MSLRLAVLVIAAVAAADQAVKHLVESLLAMGEPVPVLPFIALLRAHNTGVSFSFLGGVGPGLLVAMTAAISGIGLWFLVRTPAAEWPMRLGLALILGGALGNLADRVRFGHVVDYIFFHTPVWSFAIFNLADVAITFGAITILAEELFLRRRRAARI